MLLGATSTNLAFYDLYRTQVFAISAFLTIQECESWISFGEGQGFQEAKQKATAGYAHRDNGRIVVCDENIAHNIFLRIRSFVPPAEDGREASGCAPNLRLYRYCAGQRFGKHVDGVQKYPIPTDGSQPSEFTHQRYKKLHSAWLIWTYVCMYVVNTRCCFI